jgi:hypothetical protein
VHFPHWTSTKLDKVHEQVNDLKHMPRGIHDQRTVSYRDAVDAIGELLDLIEAWSAGNSSLTETVDKAKMATQPMISGSVRNKSDALPRPDPPKKLPNN